MRRQLGSSVDCGGGQDWGGSEGRQSVNRGGQSGGCQQMRRVETEGCRCRVGPQQSQVPTAAVE